MKTLVWSSVGLLSWFGLLLGGPLMLMGVGLLGIVVHPAFVILFLPAFLLMAAFLRLAEYAMDRESIFL